MAAAWVQDVAATTGVSSGTDYVITTSVAVAQGDHLMVIGIRTTSGATIASCADSKGNTYTVDHSGVETGNGDILGVCSAYMVTALTNTDTVTITWSSAGFNYKSAQLVEYSGIQSTSWADKAAGATAFHVPGASSIDSGATATTSQADELIFGVLYAANAAETLSATSPFNMRTQTANNDNGYKWGAIDRVVSSAAAYSALGAWSSGSNRTEAAICVTYRAAAGGGASVVPQIMHHRRLGR